MDSQKLFVKFTFLSSILLYCLLNGKILFASQITDNVSTPLTPRPYSMVPGSTHTLSRLNTSAEIRDSQQPTQRIKQISLDIKKVQEQINNRQRVLTALQLRVRKTLLHARKQTNLKNYKIHILRTQLERLETKLKLAHSEQQVYQVYQEIHSNQRETHLANLALTKAQDQLQHLQEKLSQYSMDSDHYFQSLLAEEKNLLYQQTLFQKQYQQQQAISGFTESTRSVAKTSKQVISRPKSQRKQTTRKYQTRPSNQKTAKTSRRTQQKRHINSINVANIPYFFVISGDHNPQIETELKLKKFVEAHGGKFIEGHWNNLYSDHSLEPDTTPSLELFLQQLNQKLKSIPNTASIFLIGHGLGGGSVVEAALQANQWNRTIEYLITLDPIGKNNLRANVVYNTNQSCSPPSGNLTTDQHYINCFDHTLRRQITKNVKHFYNRWQKDNKAPLDYHRALSKLYVRNKVGRSQVNSYSSLTASGKFIVNDRYTVGNQKRLFFNHNPKAHHLTLTQSAPELTNLVSNYFTQQ